jgi:predicted metal-dependent peptidase
MMLKHVFFAALVMSTEMVEDETCPTAWTDMVRIGYNPKFIESLNIDVVMFVLAHEAMHIMLKHGLRRAAATTRRWNIACDFAINWQLKQAGFTIWEHALCDEKYAGMSAEQIYDIREKERRAQAWWQGEGPGPEGQGGKPGQGVPDTARTDDRAAWAATCACHENMDPEMRAEIEQSIQQRVAQAAMQQRMPARCRPTWSA